MKRIKYCNFFVGVLVVLMLVATVSTGAAIIKPYPQVNAPASSEQPVPPTASSAQQPTVSPTAQPTKALSPTQPQSEQPTMPTQPITAAITQPPHDLPPQGKRAFLTFDDGPSNTTLRILDILDQYNAKATFFVIYHDEPDTVAIMQQIVQRGHTIALHSYTHNYSQIYSSVEAYFDDLTKIKDFVKQATGVDSDIIRFPGGSSNTVSRKYCSGIMSTLVNEVHNRGYEYFDWNCSNGDASGNNISADRLYNELVNSANINRDNLVILMHDTRAKSTTADSLPQILDYLRSNGYSFYGLTKGSPSAHHGVNN